MTQGPTARRSRTRGNRLASLLLAAVVIALPAVAQQSCLPRPGGQVILQDFSGSMGGKDGMEGNPAPARVEAARQVALQLVDQYKQLASPPPTGLVVFGHLNRQGAAHCAEAVTLAVPVPTTAGGQALARVAETVRKTQPKARTPLFDALVQGAEALRPMGGGRIVVVTDFDEEQCGPDPCTIGAKLDAMGLPLGDKIFIDYVVAVGLNRDHRKNVERFAACTKAMELDVSSIAAADAAAQRMACDSPERLPARAPPSPPLPSSPPSAAEPPAKAIVAVSLAFSEPTVLPNWNFQQIHAQAEGIDPYGNRTNPIPVAAQPSTIEISPRYPDISVSGELGLSARATVNGLLPGTRRDVPVIVDPCSLTVAVRRTDGRDADPTNLTWEIEAADGASANGAFSSATEVIKLPPGDYRVRVKGAIELPAPVSLRYAPNCMAISRFVVPDQMEPPQPRGTLRIEFRRSDPTLFNVARAAPKPVVSVRDAAGHVQTIEDNSDLTAGEYSVTYASDGGAPQDIVGVRIEPGLTTTVTITDAPGRLRIQAKHLEPVSTGLDDVEWTVRMIGSTAQEVTLRGAILDQTLPVGRYEISAVLSGHAKRREDITIVGGRLLSRELTVD